MKFFILLVVLILFYSGPASAYLGPGLSAGVIAAIAGVLLSIVMAIVGTFWYPIKRLFKKAEIEENLEGNLQEADLQASPIVTNQTESKDSSQ